jgi:hypothetical protein
MPASGIATAAAAKMCSGAVSAKSGEMKSSPVACAPRWTSATSPVTRPSNPSGTSSWAAELISTQDEPCPTPAPNPAARATPSEPATAKSAYACS